ncbi:SNF2 family DNA-dependent chromodomain-containing ATPase, partial [Aureobasidium melanogenum]
MYLEFKFHRTCLRMLLKEGMIERRKIRVDRDQGQLQWGTRKWTSYPIGETGHAEGGSRFVSPASRRQSPSISTLRLRACSGGRPQWPLRLEDVSSCLVLPLLRSFRLVASLFLRTPYGTLSASGRLVCGCNLLIQRSELLARRAFVNVLSLRPPCFGKIIPICCQHKSFGEGIEDLPEFILDCLPLLGCFLFEELASCLQRFFQTVCTLLVIRNMALRGLSDTTQARRASMTRELSGFGVTVVSVSINEPRWSLWRRERPATARGKGLLVVAVVVLKRSLGCKVGTVARLVLENTEEVVCTSHEMHGSRRLCVLLVGLGALFFDAHSVFFKIELVAHTEIRVIANSHPSTITVFCDADAQHAILASSPGTSVVSRLRSLWNAEIAPVVTKGLLDVPKHAHLERTLSQGLGVQTLDTLEVKQNSFLVFLCDGLVSLALKGQDTILLFLEEFLADAYNLIKSGLEKVDITTNNADQVTNVLLTHGARGICASVGLIVRLDVSRCLSCEVSSSLFGGTLFSGIVFPRLALGVSWLVLFDDGLQVLRFVLRFLFSLEGLELLLGDDVVPFEIKLDIGVLETFQEVCATTRCDAGTCLFSSAVDTPAESSLFLSALASFSVMACVFRHEANDRVGCHEVDTKTTSTGGKNETEVFAVRSIEVIDRLASWTGSDRTIKALILVSTKMQIVTNDVKHLDHLTEDEDTMTIRLQSGQKTIEKHHLSTARHESLELVFPASLAFENTIFGVREHERVNSEPRSYVLARQIAFISSSRACLVASESSIGISSLILIKPGMRKSMRADNSFNSFCRGVPVISRRLGAPKSMSLTYSSMNCHFICDKKAESSRMYSHSRQRHDNQKGSFLTTTHLVCKNDIVAFAPVSGCVRKGLYGERVAKFDSRLSEVGSARIVRKRFPLDKVLSAVVSDLLSDYSFDLHIVFQSLEIRLADLESKIVRPRLLCGSSFLDDESHGQK